MLARVFDMQGDTAIHVGDIAHGHLGALRDRQFIRVRDRHGVVANPLDLRIHATRVLARDRPLRTFECVACAAVVVGQRAERGQQRLARHEFALAERVGDHAALRAGEQRLASRSAHTDVPASDGDGGVGRRGRGTAVMVRRKACDHMLSERQLIAGRRPVGRLGKLLRCLQNQFMRGIAVIVDRPIHGEGNGFTRCHVEAPLGAPHRNAVGKHAQCEDVCVRRHEEVVVADGQAVLGNVDMHVRIQLLHVLRLRRRTAVRE